MDPLFRLLSPRILIQVNPQTFTFEGRRATVQLQTFLYIKQEGERCTVVCVGEEPSDTSQALRMDLFEDSSKAAGDKADGLVAFLHYAIRRVLTRRIVRPTLIFKDIHTLNPILHGYERRLLQDIAMDAGAAYVQFE